MMFIETNTALAIEKAETEKLKQEKNKLKLEVVENDIKISELKQSNAEARKFRDKIAIKIFNSTGEDLQAILKLTNEELLSKFNDTLEDLTDLRQGYI